MTVERKPGEWVKTKEEGEKEGEYERV